MARRGSRAPDPAAGPGPRGLAVGLVALAPLFAAYELAVRLEGAGGARNLAERLATRALAVAPWEHTLRLLLIAVATLAAFLQIRLARLPLGRALVRTLIEGALFALALGPLLVGALALCGVDADAIGLGGAPRGGRADVTLARALLAFGGAAWEELVFRVGLLGAAFGLVRGLLTFFGTGEPSARILAEVAGVALSALAFAAFHLDWAAAPLGLSGEAFDDGVFWWRAVAGVFLAGLFRWRGLGAAGWTHGLFNLALILGSGPGVLR